MIITCNRNILHLIICLLSLGSIQSIAQKIELLDQGKPTSIRGLSVVNDKTAWLSGSKGYVAITNDGGHSWAWQQVKGYEQADFRDIEAFSDKEAIIMSSGTPALILKTTDGGQTWDLKYRNDDKAYFLDAMAFDGHDEGKILGDPINGKFFVLETHNSGKSWHVFEKAPMAQPGEAAFAASGTCLIATGRSFLFVTGGSVARTITMRVIIGHSSSQLNLPILHGKSSQGAFSVALGKKQVIAIGGDYSDDKRTDSVCVSYFGGDKAKFEVAENTRSGYQSCIEFISGKGPVDNVYLSTGTPGTNLITEGGKNWQQIDGASYNVCRKAKKGNLVLLAGDRGRIGIFRP